MKGVRRRNREAAGWADEAWAQLSAAEKAKYLGTLTRERSELPEDEFAGRFQRVTVGLIPDHGGWRAVYADDEPGSVYTVPMVGWLVQKEMLVEGSEEPTEAVLSAEHRSFVPGCMEDGEVLEPSQSNYLGLLEPGGDEKEFAEASMEYHKQLTGKMEA